MKLHELEIRDFKVFHELNIRFNGANVVLFGVNGGGKSTVLAAICYVFRVLLNQLNPEQTKAFEKFEDDMIHISAKAHVQLKDIALLTRYYKGMQKNKREKTATYPRANYDVFKNRFKELYLSSDDVGMPIFVYYGTNRTVLDFPKKTHKNPVSDKLSALEHAMDQRLDFRTFFEWYKEKEEEEIFQAKESANLQYIDPSLQHVILERSNIWNRYLQSFRI